MVNRFGNGYLTQIPEVAKLKWINCFDIRGKMETRILSKKTKYVAYLVFRLKNEFFHNNIADAVVRFVDSQSHTKVDERTSLVSLSGRKPSAKLPSKRGDGWMEIDMGNFFNGRGEDGDVEVRLMDKRDHIKSRLIVQGIEFQSE
ncbi:F-box protein PP2-B10-like [Lycium ferocissimum]|uniref:F-box protein PP2-B10-like n=1 Tax=Lycium ferocissimum TaxID=112874 RepID=UPI002814FB3A|nr:F-box protein PP2-B10-like [Lycium ferocissimum]